MSGYSNNGGGTLGSIPDAVDTTLLRDLGESSKTDYSGDIAKIVAEKEQAAKLALVSKAHDQLDFEEAQRKADLAVLKAKRAEAEMHERQISDPKYLEALHSQYAATIVQNTRTVDAQAAAAYAAEKEAGERGLDPGAYAVDGKIDHLALQGDLHLLQQRDDFLKQGYSVEEAKKATGPTKQESYDTPATEDAPTGDLSDAPAASTAAPAAAPTSLDSVPAPGAAEPAPAPATTASGITLPAGIAPNTKIDVQSARERMRIPVARSNKKAPQFVTNKELDDAIGLTTTKEIFVDPKTQNSYETQVTKDRDGTVYKASEPILHERSKTQQTIDTEAAKDYQEYTQNHGAERDQNDVATLDTAIAILKDGKTNASGAITNLLPEGLRNFVVSEKGLKVPQMVKSVVQNHLKEIFGSRISNMEVKNAMELVFNPGLDESTNAETVSRVRTNLASALENKRDSMQYFSSHGTLEGFEPKSLKSKESEGASSTTTSGGSATLGQTKYFPGNPRAYVLRKNEVTGKNEWVGE